MSSLYLPFYPLILPKYCPFTKVIKLLMKLPLFSHQTHSTSSRHTKLPAVMAWLHGCSLQRKCERVIHSVVTSHWEACRGAVTNSS